jgi:hypothetical protein
LRSASASQPQVSTNNFNVVCDPPIGADGTLFDGDHFWHLVAWSLLVESRRTSA